ncbi:bacteriocin immunity protein [Enterococcus sp. 669A]|uniref:Bacteriocin immunity protein n=1 Tax=Candidatus Enterococcus moelleringii TaxID=2815325 RepID=A0ABS3LCC3_9ENTE|nr:bacteriocin immunity protein [Enterococcus sp. 669A]MBO1307283.1 bacteriocin immunity protein [Enterococcus sp. 669A]
METRETAQELVHDLYNCLVKQPDPSEGLQDIVDVLLQVYKKLDTAKNPEALVNRLVNYIYSVGLASRVHFDKKEEQLLIDLSVIGQRAGLNGVYRSNTSDKTQFFGYLD